MFRREDVAKVFSGDVANGWGKKSEYIQEIRGNDNEIFPMIKDCILSCKNAPIELLEVGCGDGKLLKQIDSECQCTIKLKGIELSKDMLGQINKDSFKNSITLFNCPIEKFTSKTLFDIIILKQVFHHLVNRKAVMDKLVDLLNIGGVILIMIPNENYQKDIIPYNGEKDCLGRIGKKLMNQYISDTPLKIIEDKQVESFASFPDEYHYFMFLYSIGSLQKLFDYKSDYKQVQDFIKIFKRVLLIPNKIQVNFSYSYYILQK